MHDIMRQNLTSIAGGPDGAQPNQGTEGDPKKRRGRRLSGELTIAQHRAVEAMMSHATIKSAATACGVSERTVYRWLRETAFKRALMRMQYYHINLAHASLQAITGDAVEALRKVLNDPGTAYGVLVNASRTTLTLAFELVEAEDIRYRLEHLEKLKDASPYD